MNNIDNKYTPETLSEKNLQFSIPLYQRLFEWEKEQIEQLLNDLKSAYEKDPEKPYYIGMLTAFPQNNVLDLVDGQQRFTVLMLLGICLKWEQFIKIENGELRLTFFARANDKEYLNKKINHTWSSIDYVNQKMENAIDVINNFLANISFKNASKTNEDFQTYIFEKITFFISMLPNEYDLFDLNKYFESMNATGKGLENHEILKVALIKNIDDNQVNYTRIWNAVSQMDKPMVRHRTDKENVDQFQERFKNAINKIIKNENIFGKQGICDINDLYNTENNIETENDTLIIKKIEPSSNKPSIQIRSEGSRAIITFSEFLLQVLYLTLEQNISTPITDFFDTHKLQETFNNHRNNYEIKTFIENLLLYRLLFDYFVIKVGNNDASYLLDNFKSDDGIKNSIIQYQSMLYVSTSSHIWLTPLLIELAKNQKNKNELLNLLKNIDNEYRKKITKFDLSYGAIDRYWFWRLDYYLWEQEQAKTGKKDEAITKYIFRANRSIEHLHPQTDDQFPIKWDKEQKDKFGNLAMISSSFNSTQSNESIQVKFARVSEQIEKIKLESIKLYEMYKIAEKDDKKWTIDLANKHGNKMIDILIKSFCPSYNNDCKIDCNVDNCYFGIRD